MTEQQLRDAATYMDNETRERIHSELAPCSPDKFWLAYVAAVGEDVAAEVAALAGVKL